MFINSWNKNFTSGFMNIYICIMKMEHYQEKNVYLPLFTYDIKRVGNFSLKVLLFATVWYIFVDS